MTGTTYDDVEYVLAEIITEATGEPRVGRFERTLAKAALARLRELGLALSTPPADDVREALAVARNVEQYLDMLALRAEEDEDAVIDDGYDGDGVIQSLDVSDLRTLVASVFEVRPRGTVADAEVSHVQHDLGQRFHGLSYRERLIVRAALEAAREVHP